MTAPTSKERREVAERLRGLDAEIASRDTLEQAVDKLMKAVYGEQPFSPVRYSVRNLCGLGYVIADLVDPTCEIDSVEPIECGEFNQIIGYAFDLTCGHSVMRPYMDMPPAYCDECGCRVVSDDD